MDALNEVYDFYRAFAGEKFSVGTSVLGRDIPCMKCGTGRPFVIVQYAIHAREWITSLLALSHISNFSSRGTFYFLPVTNPDGVALALNGLSSVKERSRADFLRGLNGGDDFSLWKANANGVDLNVNFDARWGAGIKNVFSPARENFVGSSPESEPETRALAAFTQNVCPDATVSYHSKGEEIYWYFEQEPCDSERDFRIARALAATTGYAPAYTPGSAGGYKDWCIRALHIPSFTIEVGSDGLEHPVGLSQLGRIAAQNKYVPATLAEELLWTKR